jgi:plasmid stability protein
MKTLTLRNVPEEVVEQLSAIAKETHQSMNGAAVLALRRALGLDAGPRRKRDLSAFAGAWKKKEFESFEKATAGFSAIDEELWRK